MFELCFFKGSRAKFSPQEALPLYHYSQAWERENHSDIGYLDVLGQMDLLSSRDGSPSQSAETLSVFKSLPVTSQTPVLHAYVQAGLISYQDMLKFLLFSIS